MEMQFKKVVRSVLLCELFTLFPKMLPRTCIIIFYYYTQNINQSKKAVDKAQQDGVAFNEVHLVVKRIEIPWVILPGVNLH